LRQITGTSEASSPLICKITLTLWDVSNSPTIKLPELIVIHVVMSYDLHGPWDTDVKTLGSIVRP
jgi:hypothetical protein